jgi:glycosyltransferase involved in cell wall biosynthesis
MKKHQVCNLCFSTTASDGRIQRQIRHTTDEFQLTVHGKGDWTPPNDSIRFVPMKRQYLSNTAQKVHFCKIVAGRFMPRFFDTAYWSWPFHNKVLQSLLDNGPYELIHANDMETLPVACRAAKQMNARVLFDAHEYHPGQIKFLHGMNRLVQPAYISYLLRQYLPQTDMFVTTSTGFANLYDEHFGCRPQVILNAPEPTDVSFRQVDPKCIRLVHHGGAKESRRLEVFIEMMRHLDQRFHLTLMLMPDGRGYVDQLKQLAKEISSDRISFCEPVATDAISATISKFDIGVHALPPICLNHVYPVPNKLLEFISAGLVCIIGPSPDMAAIVEQHQTGVVAKDHTAIALANALNSLSIDQMNEMKANSLHAAKIYNADVEMKKLVSLYHQALSD